MSGAPEPERAGEAGTLGDRRGAFGDGAGVNWSADKDLRFCLSSLAFLSSARTSTLPLSPRFLFRDLEALPMVWKSKVFFL